MAGGFDNIGHNQEDSDQKNLEQSRLDNLDQLGLVEQDEFPDPGVMDPEDVDGFAEKVIDVVNEREKIAIKELKEAMEASETTPESPDESGEEDGEKVPEEVQEDASADIDGWKEDVEVDQALAESVQKKGLSVDNLGDYIVGHLDINEGPLKTLAEEVANILKANLTPDASKIYSPEALAIATKVKRLVDQFNQNEAEIKAFAQNQYNG